MITFESVADYPNGYQLTNDEWYAIHAIIEKDPSWNYKIVEVWDHSSSYYLDVMPLDDAGWPTGPHYHVQSDGTTEECGPKLKIYKDLDDGAWIADIPGHEWSESCWTQQEAFESGAHRLKQLVGALKILRGA